MALYFFHIENHIGRTIDEEGIECADSAAVRDQAIRNARSLISHEALDGFIDMRAVIEVTDDDGKQVLELDYAEAVELRLRPV